MSILGIGILIVFIAVLSGFLDRENKNYTEVAKNLISERILNMEFTTPQKISIKMQKIVNIKGEVDKN